uniref:Uncharacterized protein n=1 Tax=Parascaris univalens TaxID=6257 RepID=A0A915CBN2_PARUN
GIPATRRPVWTSLTDVWRTYCSVSLIHQAPNKRRFNEFSMKLAHLVDNVRFNPTYANLVFHSTIAAE